MNRIEELRELIVQAEELKAKHDDGFINCFVDNFKKEFGEFFSIQKIEAVLNDYKKRLNNIIRAKMPEIMNENQITNITIDGKKLKLKKGITPIVIDEREMTIWMEEQGLGDSVKTELKFDKGEVDEKLLCFIEEYGYSFVRKDGVHYQTLKKILSDRYENGEELPPANIINITAYDEVVIN
jgi:hypothetical protein